MISSIRKFLLINLLLAITTTTSLTIIGHFYLIQQDVQEYLDNVLSETAFTLHTLFTHQLNKNHLQTIPEPSDNNPLAIKKTSSKPSAKIDPILQLQAKYQFQIWDDAGHIVLRSSKAPTSSLLSKEQGLSDKTINHTVWRIYTLHDPSNHLHLAVAEKYDIRSYLARLITKDDIYIMLLTYPLSGLLIWFIIGCGLSSLKKVTTEVAYRAPAHLEPVDPESVPIEIKPLVAALNNLFIRLQQAFEREQRFAADAAHELRTPLAAIRTQAQVAIKSTENTDTQSLLQNVIAGVDRSVHIVQQLLTLSRLTPEAGLLNDIIQLDIVKLCVDLIALLAPIAIDKNITIELIAPEQNVDIRGNVTALSILLRNLIDNAIRYTPEGGHIKVTIEQPPHSIILKVSDNGPGIPEELRERVFERFYRILGSASPGSGLGLAIVQKIAHLHSAEIQLSSPAMGTGLEISVIFQKDTPSSKRQKML